MIKNNFHKNIKVVLFLISILLNTNVNAQNEVQDFFESLFAAVNIDNSYNGNDYCINIHYEESKTYKSTCLTLDMGCTIYNKDKTKGFFFGSTDQTPSPATFVLIDFDFKSNTATFLSEAFFLTLQTSMKLTSKYLYVYSILNNDFYPENPRFYRLNIDTNIMETFALDLASPSFDLIIDFQPEETGESITIKTQAMGSGGYTEQTVYTVNEKKKIVSPKS